MDHGKCVEHELITGVLGMEPPDGSGSRAPSVGPEAEIFSSIFIQKRDQ